MISQIHNQLIAFSRTNGSRSTYIWNKTIAWPSQTNVAYNYYYFWKAVSLRSDKKMPTKMNQHINIVCVRFFDKHMNEKLPQKSA